jgi:hypothetical protein
MPSKIGAPMEACMNIAIATALFAAITVFNLGSSLARAADMVDFRSDHIGANCRIVEIQTTNRWGTEMTVRRLICG